MSECFGERMLEHTRWSCRRGVGPLAAFNNCFGSVRPRRGGGTSSAIIFFLHDDAATLEPSNIAVKSFLP
jgi:hypothetical protein